MRIAIVFDDTGRFPRENLEKALRFLKVTDLGLLRPGVVTPIDGDEVFAQVQEYETRAEERLDFESHNVYYDLHYLVTGNEYIYCTTSRDLIPKTVYNRADDILFYEDPAWYGRFLLKAGNAAFIAPGDAHKPRCFVDKPETVRKIVVKVKAHTRYSEEGIYV
jgi:YhcH/YjgK/YiaL family protein